MRLRNARSRPVSFWVSPCRGAGFVAASDDQCLGSLGDTVFDAKLVAVRLCAKLLKESLCLGYFSAFMWNAEDKITVVKTWNIVQKDKCGIYWIFLQLFYYTLRIMGLDLDGSQNQRIRVEPDRRRQKTGSHCKEAETTVFRARDQSTEALHRKRNDPIRTGKRPLRMNGE